MFSPRHPNIIQFYGICLLPNDMLPMIIMEQLQCSLHAFLDDRPDCSLTCKFSILEDVARGLTYLHDRPSPVIHRDLTAKNVFLTSSVVAKIMDMGNSRIMEPGVYMPPEDTHCYGPALDIFSFGHLALYVIIQGLSRNCGGPTNGCRAARGEGAGGGSTHVPHLFFFCLLICLIVFCACESRSYRRISLFVVCELGKCAFFDEGMPTLCMLES